MDSTNDVANSLISQRGPAATPEDVGSQDLEEVMREIDALSEMDSADAAGSADRIAAVLGAALEEGER